MSRTTAQLSPAASRALVHAASGGPDGPAGPETATPSSFGGNNAMALRHSNSISAFSSMQNPNVVLPSSASFSAHMSYAATEPAMYELMKEMAVMKKLDHPNVVKLYEVIHDPEQKLLVMVMEFLPGGSIVKSTLPGLSEPLPEDVARGYFR